MAGRFIKTFSYSGPTYGNVHVEQRAQDGKTVYVDRNYTFAGLPKELHGADWFQAPDSDAFYSAVDLIQIAVSAGTTVSVAHDDRLPRPIWLTTLFQPTDLSITVNGRSMKIFQRATAHEESLTLGSNVDDISVKTGNMYVVFVNAAH
jgi:beta-galactosidase